MFTGWLVTLSNTKHSMSGQNRCDLYPCGYQTLCPRARPVILIGSFSVVRCNIHLYTIVLLRFRIRSENIREEPKKNIPWFLPLPLMLDASSEGLEPRFHKGIVDGLHLPWVFFQVIWFWGRYGNIMDEPWGAWGFNMVYQSNGSQDLNPGCIPKHQHCGEIAKKTPSHLDDSVDLQVRSKVSHFVGKLHHFCRAPCVYWSKSLDYCNISIYCHPYTYIQYELMVC